MNNILNYNDFLKTLEVAVYAQEVNEGTGIKGFFNKRAGKKVAKRLEEEIEMSKSIMDGIREGLESLNDNFDAIKKGLKDDDKEVKGEKQKQLDAITKILEDSRKQTWDLQELIDEGEIDYAGFTANAGLATVTYFGILLFPVRASVILHKSYNYFFTLIKNTVRKALVMLQLNFDQFQNLIIVKSFQSEGYQAIKDTNSEIAKAFGELNNKLWDPKTGLMRNKKGAHEAEAAYKMAVQQMKEMRNSQKNEIQQYNSYNMLNPYDNTYTKSLESLRTYSQEDVQKELDAIKNSMNKLATGDVDLQAYGELLIAMAEEHAYKVSSSIYNKFAKMTEVFSLPNQKKMIDLIQSATEEEANAAKEREKKAAEKERDTEEVKRVKEITEKAEKIFKDVKGGAKLGDKDEKTGEYTDVDGKNWTADAYEALDDEKKVIFEEWIYTHPEVLKKCDDSLKMILPTRDKMYPGYFEYVDSLIDELYLALGKSSPKKKKYTPKRDDDEKEDGDDVSESYVFDFERFILEEAKKESQKSINKKADLHKLKKHIDENSSSLSLVFDWLDIKKGENISVSQRSCDKITGLLNTIEKCKGNDDELSEDDKKIVDAIKDKVEEEKIDTWYTEIKKFLNDLNDAVTQIKEKRKKKSGGNTSSNKGATKDLNLGGETVEVEISPDLLNDEDLYYINLGKCDTDEQRKHIRELFIDTNKSRLALKMIGEKVIDDKNLNKNAKTLASKISEVFDKDDESKFNVVSISESLYTKLKEAIKQLDDERNHDYPIFNKTSSSENNENSNKKEEKSED